MEVATGWPWRPATSWPSRPTETRTGQLPRPTSVGLTCSSTTSRVITHRATSLRLGMSYITESRTSSAIQDCDESDVLVPDLLTWRVRSWSVGTPAIRTSDHGQYPVRDMPKAARVLAALQRDGWTETRRRGSHRVLVKAWCLMSMCSRNGVRVPHVVCSRNLGPQGDGFVLGGDDEGLLDPVDVPGQVRRIGLGVELL